MVIWGFVDYENTGSLEEIDIKTYQRLLVFCGPKNSRIKLGELSTTEFTKIELIGIKTSGANNLDFHLAFYLGRMHEKANSDIEFHIISNDDGFNGVVNHIKNIGRECKKVATRKKFKESANKQTKSMVPLSACAMLIASRLKQIDGKKRPRKKDSLTNWIKSQCSHIKPPVTASLIFEELSGNSFISVNNSNVSYNL